MPWRRPQHPLPAQRGATSSATYARASARAEPWRRSLAGVRQRVSRSPSPPHSLAAAPTPPVGVREGYLRPTCVCMPCSRAARATYIRPRADAKTATEGEHSCTPSVTGPLHTAGYTHRARVWTSRQNHSTILLEQIDCESDRTSSQRARKPLCSDSCWSPVLTRCGGLHFKLNVCLQ